MSNLPLDPLVWSRLLSTRSAFHLYTVRADSENKDKFVVLYCRRHETAKLKKATGFPTVELAKEWCWNHYNEKMQPYVKPSPTWVDVDDRLPERKELLSDKDKCLVLTECGKVWTGFYNMNIKPDAWYLHGWTEKQGWHPFKIVAWMLASEFSTMQNLHNASEVTK